MKFQRNKKYLGVDRTLTKQLGSFNADLSPKKRIYKQNKKDRLN